MRYSADITHTQYFNNMFLIYEMFKDFATKKRGIHGSSDDPITKSS